MARLYDTKTPATYLAKSLDMSTTTKFWIFLANSRHAHVTRSPDRSLSCYNIASHTRSSIDRFKWRSNDCINVRV